MQKFNRFMELEMNEKKLLLTGIVGTLIAALCCFTPVLVILFGIVGLSAVVGYLDYVLFPVLGFFIVLTIYAVWRRHKIQRTRG